MKKILFVVLILLSASPLFAQIQRHVEKKQADSSETATISEQNPAGRKQILKELDLTKEQKNQLKELNQSMKALKTSIENDASLSEKEKKSKLQSLRKAQNTKLLALLTEEQKIKLKQLREGNL